MARSILYNIFCDVTNNEYTQGDVIDVYYNEGDIEVELNGSIVTSGGFILSEKQFYTIIQNPFSFCEGANAVSYPFKQSFPYVERVSEFSNVCAVGVCDIIKSGVPNVVKVSAAGLSDGSITVQATSSNTIKYALFDFDYNTQGQSSGTFSGLSAGNYTIYATDSIGCSVSWNINLGTETLTNYGVYEYWEFRNKIGQYYKVELLKRDYSGSSTEREFSGSDPVRRITRAENGTRANTSVISSMMDFDVISETDKEYLELFAAADETEYIIKYYHKPSSTYNLIWQGYPTTELYSEPYEYGKYTCTITATDRLADLRDEPFLFEGNNIFGDITVLEAIKICLDKTNMGLSYRVAMNLYESNMDSGAGDDPLNQLYRNADSYYSSGDPDDCYTVLEKALSSVYCTLQNYGGYWYIIYMPEASTTYNYREFDENLAYQSNSSISPIIDFKQVTASDRVTWKANSNSVSFDQIYKTVNIDLPRKIRDSLVTQLEDRYIDGNNAQGWSKKLNTEEGNITIIKDGTITVIKEFLAIEPSFDYYSGRRVVTGGRQGRGGVVVGSGGNTRPKTNVKTTVEIDGYYWKFDFKDNQGGKAAIEYTDDIEFRASDSFVLNIPVLFDYGYNQNSFLP